MPTGDEAEHQENKVPAQERCQLLPDSRLSRFELGPLPQPTFLAPGRSRCLTQARLRWTLRYPQSSEPVNHPFFDGLKQVDIGSMLHFVNRHCPFMEAFAHVLGRYTKQAADDSAIIACLVAWGTNMGLGRMGDISDVGYHTLATTSDNFIRP